MLLMNFDFYDIYAVLLAFRSMPTYHQNTIIAKAVKAIIDAPQNGDTVESNIVRQALSRLEGIDQEHYGWVFTQNIYTYGHAIVKSDVAYRILSAAFSELLQCLDNEKFDQFGYLSDVLHNVPVILTKDPKHIKRLIKNETSDYRQIWNKNFLRDFIK